MHRQEKGFNTENYNNFGNLYLCQCFLYDEKTPENYFIGHYPSAACILYFPAFFNNNRIQAS